MVCVKILILVTIEFETVAESQAERIIAQVNNSYNAPVMFTANYCAAVHGPGRKNPDSDAL